MFLTVEATESTSLAQQLVPTTLVIKASLSLAKMQKHQQGLVGYLDSAKPAQRTKATSGIVLQVTQVQTWTIETLAGNEDEQAAVRLWVARVFDDSWKSLQQHMEKLKAAAEEVVSGRLSRAIEKLKPWARGAPNTKSWKAGLAADCSWAELLTASASLTNKQVADEVTTHFGKMLEEPCLGNPLLQRSKMHVNLFLLFCGTLATPRFHSKKSQALSLSDANDARNLRRW